jgi:hypothetical protein
MNNNWQHNIQNHTEMPPAGVWDRIANELDAPTILQQKVLTHSQTPPVENWEQIENKIDAPLQHIQAFEEIPPVGIWDKINNELNQQNNTWQQKIEQIAITPPSAVWSNITSRLDNENSTWQQKIAAFEVPPPQHNWQHIANSLAANEKTISIAPIKKVVPLNFKMTAAAAVIIGIALTTLLLNKKQPLLQSQTAAISPIVQHPLLQANDTIPLTTSLTAAQQTTAKSNTTLHKKNTPTTIIDIDTNYNKTLLLANTTEIELSNPTDKLFTKLTNTNGEQTNDIAMLNTPNSYINITGPNGDQIKVSAKFSKMINLLKERDTTKTEYLDKIIKEGAVWKMKFKTWREKMNNSNITPTPANFMNIIELSKILKENK